MTSTEDLDGPFLPQLGGESPDHGAYDPGLDLTLLEQRQPCRLTTHGPLIPLNDGRCCRPGCSTPGRRLGRDPLYQS